MLTAQDCRLLYPLLYDNIEQKVYEDIRLRTGGILTDQEQRSIASNAAYESVQEIEKAKKRVAELYIEYSKCKKLDFNKRKEIRAELKLINLTTDQGEYNIFNNKKFE